MGLLGRSGAGACPNLPQRRLAAGLAARRSPECQRFSFGASAGSKSLWRFGQSAPPWTPGRGATGRAAATVGVPTTGRARGKVARSARSSLNPRARTSSRRARGLSDVLAGRVDTPWAPPDAEMRTSHSRVQFQPSFSRAECASRRGRGRRRDPRGPRRSPPRNISGDPVRKAQCHGRTPVVTKPFPLPYSRQGTSSQRVG